MGYRIVPYGPSLCVCSFRRREKGMSRSRTNVTVAGPQYARRLRDARPQKVKTHFSSCFGGHDLLIALLFVHDIANNKHTIYQRKSRRR